MKKDKIRRTILIRTFSALLAIYLILMAAFSIFLLRQADAMKKMELLSFILQVNGTIGDKLQNYTDNKTGTTDILKIKKEFVNDSSFFQYAGTELALYSGDYRLIFNTNDYWICSYTERTEGNTGYAGYGCLNAGEWFSENDIAEIESCLYFVPKEKKKGDLSGYSVDLDGFWADNERIIPEKITVTPMYVNNIDRDGNVSSSSGADSNKKIFTAKYNKKSTEGLQYYKHGSIIPKYIDSQNERTRTELRKLVTDGDKLKNYVEHIVSSNGFSVERVDLFTYRYYRAQPFKNTVKLAENNKNYSEFWVVFARDINLLGSCAGTLAFVWTVCFIVFMTAAAILSAQTYKTYRKKEELERRRIETANALAHDLKTPLCIISGYTQNLMENIHTDKREHYAQNIQTNVERMDKIIKEMLELSKLEADSIKLKFEEVSLGSLCTGIINRYKEVCAEKGIAAGLDGDAFVMAERSMLERVIDNFFVNAMDHVPEHGVISIRIFDNTFEIFNSGSRIPDHMTEEIWQPYKKADLSRSNSKGTGLGLSITRTILELHAFPYGAKNTGGGVIFWFKFA